eukprot:c31204_g1_i1 orf=2-169(-)
MLTSCVSCKFYLIMFGMMCPYNQLHPSQVVLDFFPCGKRVPVPPLSLSFFFYSIQH